MTTDLISRYFELATSPDRERWFALFADDVVVEDDGRTHRGIDEVRAWRTEVPSVTYDVTDVSTQNGYHVATADIAGDFPGSPIPLRFHFIAVEDGLIRHLAIRP
ncbi:nuclear transport factor 2 family protein [Aeromicrobium sp.]|uniref:nuclear transport factor 2 family protein n=1 Tax=Aeromicrobium sp. TaxID=1871063 RepID=UPI002FC5DB8C